MNRIKITGLGTDTYLAVMRLALTISDEVSEEDFIYLLPLPSDNKPTSAAIEKWILECKDIALDAFLFRKVPEMPKGVEVVKAVEPVKVEPARAPVKVVVKAEHKAKEATKVLPPVSKPAPKFETVETVKVGGILVEAPKKPEPIKILETKGAEVPLTASESTTVTQANVIPPTPEVPVVAPVVEPVKVEAPKPTVIEALKAKEEAHAEEATTTLMADEIVMFDRTKQPMIREVVNYLNKTLKKGWTEDKKLFADLKLYLDNNTLKWVFTKNGVMNQDLLNAVAQHAKDATYAAPSYSPVK